MYNKMMIKIKIILKSKILNIWNIKKIKQRLKYKAFTKEIKHENSLSQKNNLKLNLQIQTISHKQKIILLTKILKMQPERFNLLIEEESLDITLNQNKIIKFHKNQILANKIHKNLLLLKFRKLTN